MFKPNCCPKIISKYSTHFLKYKIIKQKNTQKQTNTQKENNNNTDKTHKLTQIERENHIKAQVNVQLDFSQNCSTYSRARYLQFYHRCHKWSKTPDVDR